MYLGFEGLVVKGLSLILCWLSVGAVALVAWNEPKKAKFKPKRQGFFTAYNYKKCGKEFLEVNKIKVLEMFEVKKSVIRFEFVKLCLRI